jgi:superfamily II DNA/RNA helicase
MTNLYLALTSKIIEKNSGPPESINNVKNEIRFIADQLSLEQGIEAHIDSAFCYYIAGYYVHAMYLARQINLNVVDPIQKWLLLFLRKDLQKLKEELTIIVADKKYDDQYIRDKIETKGLSDVDALNLIVNFKIAEILTNLLHFIGTGEDGSISKLFKTIEICQRLVSKSGIWVVWWRLEFLKIIAKEFIENSLWNHLKVFSTNKESSQFVKKYITANYHQRKIIELWRTQIESLPRINDPSRTSFCISVPTSGGKTMVAEIAVLQFLLDYKDQPKEKCVYIAPFRKLALEVEDTFFNDFSFIDSSLTSTFYGGREIDIFDIHGLEKARILIVTPEKLDSMLRQYPDLLPRIKLVIADEGHMIGDQNLRGYRYRFLLERLIYKFSIRRATTDEKPRIILISGVLPNVEDFADLLSGNRENFVKVDWRPLDKPTIGTWDWTGLGLRTYDSNLVEPIPFDTKCESSDGFEEIVVKVALTYAHTHPTMVFSASKRAITSPSLLKFLECVATNHKLFVTKPLPKNLTRSNNFRQYYLLLEKGIAIHHAGLPRELRKEMENRIDDGQIRLLFASPTLANGVNIPFHHVLIYRLQHYYGLPIPPATFWNVVGRVGRPIKNKTNWNVLVPPSVLFFLNKSWKSNDEDQKDSRLSIELRDKRAQYQVASSFLIFIQQIRDRWYEKNSNSISELVSNLAEKDKLKDALGNSVYSTLQPINKISVDDFLKILDEHICALLAENSITENNASEWLQQSASDLIDLFVKVSDIDTQFLDDIKRIILARIKFTIQHLSSEKRHQNYLLGLPVNDCEEIKMNEGLLLNWYQECSGMFSQDFDYGLNSFISILNFVAGLSICKKWRIKQRTKNKGQLTFDFKIPDVKTVAQRNLFSQWIAGEESKYLENSLNQFLPKIDFDTYREGMFENNLPWGVSAILRYLNLAADQKGITFTKDLDYLATFVKYGVNSKIACHLVRIGIPRINAVKIANLCQDKLRAIEINDDEIPNIESDFSEAIKSLNTITDKELIRLKIGRKTVKRINNIRQSYNKEIANTEPEFAPFEFDILDDNEYLMDDSE